MFDVPPKCPALADKLTGIFGWRHTYRVSQKHRGITHSYLQKSYSLTLPRKDSGSFLKLNLEPESWVAVHHLQTQSGILDPDDCLRDVADDREQILASYDDSGPDPGVQQGGGDGASGSSSVGTGSPDIFRDPTNTDATTGNNHLTDASIPHIEVTSTTSSSGSHTGLGLQVRRSSDPNLIQSLQNEITTNKRWSAAAPACGSDTPERILDKVVYLSPQFEEEEDTQNTYPPQTQNFARSGRLSMQFLGDGNGYKWMEAAEKLQNNQHSYQQSAMATSQQYTSKSLPRETGKRKEPLGQAYESIREKDGEMLLIINEYGGPLGLTAIPDREHGGLLVQHVEKDSRAERGRLRKGDRILEINGTKLVGLAEGKVQEHWRRCTATNELRVRVIRAKRIVPPPAIKSNQKNTESTKVNLTSEMVEIGAATTMPVGTKVATVSPTKKIPGAQVGNSLQVSNTRKLGRKIDINLKKGLHGLGFSVTTRDNPAGGHCPIYIKNILPRGAAIEDGRLKPGDRLLEVDGVPMTGKSQSDVVAILRSTQPGATVKIVVSRQQELAEYEEKVIVNNFSEEQEDAANIPPKPPAPVLPPQYSTVEKNTSHNSRVINHKDSNNYININSNQHFIDGGSESATSADSIQTGTAWRNREVLTLHIPVHDTEKAGLGVSVKGKTSSGNSSNGSNNSMKHDGDLGIFVKNVLHGGAASRDGRLRMNDQLLSVNGVSLLGQNNAEAMETLRRAMLHTPGKHPGIITLSVARKISRSASSGDIMEREREREQHDSSNNSEHSGATVIYLSPDKKDQKSNEMNRWSNPVLDRLTGGVCSANSQNNKNNRPSPLMNHGLRNDSYYIATNDTWSSVASDQQMQQMHLNAINNSVLIEDDAEPMSPTLPHRPNDSVSTQNSSISNGLCDATYSSQLSLDTNNSAEAFSRDAVGRRSISEKHHAALDARETGTYQRNKKLREERERERRIQLTKSAYMSDSIDSLTHINGNSYGEHLSGKRRLVSDLTAEALDKISDLGPSLGMKKSSSLESLQTMVQEIQMSDDTRGGPSALKAPRGRGREDSLRAAVVAGPETKPRKHWLLEDGVDGDGGFPNRNGPFQSSLNDGKIKSRAKKPSILRGIGHMFRFGKHRKDCIIETTSDFGIPPPLPPANNPQHNSSASHSGDRSKSGPPIYQPPPPPIHGVYSNDNYGHRYQQPPQHNVNYEELQHQISYVPNDVLSESTLESMRLQVMIQRSKVEQESRRNPQYYSQRSARSQDIPIHSNQHHKNNNNNNNQISNYHHQHHNNLQQSQHQQHHSSSQQQPQHLLAQIGGRPISSYYEYETIHHNVTPLSSSGRGTTKQQQLNGTNRIPLSPSKHWKSSTLNNNNNNNTNTNHFQNINLNGSGRQRGPFVTQVTIRDQSQMISSSSSSSSAITTNGQGSSQTTSSKQQSIYGMKHPPGQQPHASKV